MMESTNNTLTGSDASQGVAVCGYRIGEIRLSEVQQERETLQGQGYSAVKKAVAVADKGDIFLPHTDHLRQDALLV